LLLSARAARSFAAKGYVYRAKPGAGWVLRQVLGSSQKTENKAR
jgi:hypothetical protein